LCQHYLTEQRFRTPLCCSVAPFHWYIMPFHYYVRLLRHYVAPLCGNGTSFCYYVALLRWNGAT